MTMLQSAKVESSKHIPMASMGLKIYAGRTLCLPIPSRQAPHLFIALTGSRSYQDPKVVLVNFTKLGSGRSKDTTVVLQPGAHPFISVATVVNYSDAFIAQASNMLQLINAGKANFMDDCELTLLDRIQTGALQSPFIDPEVSKMVSDYLN